VLTVLNRGSWNSFSDANLPGFDDVGLKETIAGTYGGCVVD
jgi:hypothetical protein